MGLGPQYGGDPPFAARMRLHQSWYRAHILQVPYGVGPTPKATSCYGNFLTAKDGAAGRNFLTPEIAEVARERVRQRRGTLEPYRLFHNMLSSQPMCFNLFGPLVQDHALAARLLDPLVPEIVAEVTRVAIEWAPEPAADYLGDRTAFDAFIEYRSTAGRLCALGSSFASLAWRGISTKRLRLDGLVDLVRYSGRSDHTCSYRSHNLLCSAGSVGQVAFA